MKKNVVLAAVVIGVSLSVLHGSAWARGGGGRSGGSHSHASSSHPGGSHSVRGHVTKRGTYVAPHHATNRDNSTKNNWSHKGNANPYTGKSGTKND